MAAVAAPPFAIFKPGFFARFFAIIGAWRSNVTPNMATTLNARRSEPQRSAPSWTKGILQLCEKKISACRLQSRGDSSTAWLVKKRFGFFAETATRPNFYHSSRFRRVREHRGFMLQNQQLQKRGEGTPIKKGTLNKKPRPLPLLCGSSISIWRP